MKRIIKRHTFEYPLQTAVIDKKKEEKLNISDRKMLKTDVSKWQECSDGLCKLINDILNEVNFLFTILIIVYHKLTYSTTK